MSKHRAAQIVAAGQPVKVVEIPTPSPSENQILILVRAWAINPVDHIHRDEGLFIKSWPTIVGYDVAGEIVKVGGSVESHRVGDRVLAVVTAGFQELVIAPAVAVTKIPDWLSFKKAVVIGLSAATAAAGLYQKHVLGLDLPCFSPQSKGEKLLVWGAGSSVAASVIQFATASGYEVVATSSPKHFAYVKSLGASTVLDYHSVSIIDSVTAELQRGTCAGAYDTISTQETQLTIATILARVGGGKMASVRHPLAPEIVPATVQTKTVGAMSIFAQGSPVGQAIFQDFLPQAIVTGQYVAQPETEVMGNGIGAVQEAMDRHKAGVSAKKLVVLA